MSRRKAVKGRRKRASQPSATAVAHGERPAPDLILFAVAIACSAFLVFLVQPMVGKRLLPWYGGAPGVWTLCLAFYQTTLFAGYVYAHLLMRLGRPRLEFGLHALLFVAALLALPVLPGEAFRPEVSADATRGILVALVSKVALPFLFLAATGPIVQSWFARAHPGRAPYFLYALSNTGSLCALFAYPFLFEPNLGLAETGSSWTLGFMVGGVAVLGCGAIAVTRSPRAEPTTVALPQRVPERARTPEVALWMGLSGLAVVLLMGVTNELCLDIASVPFLWILPLAVYLLTFILCFASERFYRRTPLLLFVALATLLLPLSEAALGANAEWMGVASRFIVIGLHLSLLFAACMVLHGELYRRRPAVESLTAYYLWISAGGALGGLFVGIAAPRWFVDYYEVPVGFAAWWLLALGLAMRDSNGWLRGGSPPWRRVVAGVVALLAMVSMVGNERFETEGVVHQERSFFGVLRVISSEAGEAPAHVLRHGTTLHGLQLTGVNLRRLPTSYYGFAGGVGLALQGAARKGPIRVGVIGLGAGTLAAYGRQGDLYRFYEIDPAVIALAQGSEFFTFLGDSRAEIDIIEADGRLALEEEERLQESGWDVLVVDAFSSAAVPVHLLTREAFSLYARRLAPGGVVAIHVSNRHLALTELTFELARSVGLPVLELRTASAPALNTVSSRWVMMARKPEHLSSLLESVSDAQRSLRLPRNHVGLGLPDRFPSPRFSVWTDDYSDLFGILAPPRG